MNRGRAKNGLGLLVTHTTCSQRCNPPNNCKIPEHHGFELHRYSWPFMGEGIVQIVKLVEQQEERTLDEFWLLEASLSDACGEGFYVCCWEGPLIKTNRLTTETRRYSQHQRNNGFQPLLPVFCEDRAHQNNSRTPTRLTSASRQETATALGP